MKSNCPEGSDLDPNAPWKDNNEILIKINAAISCSMSKDINITTNANLDELYYDYKYKFISLPDLISKFESIIRQKYLRSKEEADYIDHQLAINMLACNSNDNYMQDTDKRWNKARSNSYKYANMLSSIEDWNIDEFNIEAL